MKTVLTRVIVLFAALLLAGTTIGCEREVGEQEGVGVGEEEGVGLGEQEQPGIGQEQQPSVAQDEQAGIGQEKAIEEVDFEDMEFEDAAEELAEGLRDEDKSLQDTRDDVADELGVPTEMVSFSPEVRQAIIDAETDWEAQAQGRVALVEGMIGRIDQNQLQTQDRQVYTNVQNSIGSARGSLEQMGAEDSQNYDQLKSQIEDDLESIEKDFDQLADNLQRGMPAGGGPME